MYMCRQLSLLCRCDSIRPTPPAGVITTDPVDAPLQITLVMAVVAVIACRFCDGYRYMIVQSFASVTVNVYVPAASQSVQV